MVENKFTIINDNYPWDDLEIPKDNSYFSTRRIKQPTKHNFFWVKNYKDQKGFLLNFKNQANSLQNFPKFKNLDFHLIKDKMTFIIFVNNEVNLKIFYYLCSNIINSCLKINNKETMTILQSISYTLKNWEIIFEKDNYKEISLSGRIGLLGELLVLKDIIFKNIDVITGLNSWRGADGDSQDFIYKKHALEIKTKLISSQKNMSIASLEQLDNENKEIYIILNYLSVSNKDVKETLTLSSLIKSIVDKIENNSIEKDIFIGKLIRAGIDFDKTNLEECYLLVNRLFLKVDDYFPKITKSMISSSILKAKYDINIENLDKFERSISEFQKEVFGNE